MGETYECDRELERKSRTEGQTNVCNSADVEDSPHNGDRLVSGGLELEDLRSGGRGVGSGRLGSGSWGRTPIPSDLNPP